MSLNAHVFPWKSSRTFSPPASRATGMVSGWLIFKTAASIKPTNTAGTFKQYSEKDIAISYNCSKEGRKEGNVLFNDTLNTFF